jgi:hypothetical protein
MPTPYVSIMFSVLSIALGVVTLTISIYDTR